MRSLTVKERILLHLFDLSRFAVEYEAPLETSQDGISEAAGIRVHHLNQYVRPLIQSGLVEERTSHVKGQSRRRKVYFLTSKGRQEAGALRGTLLREEIPFRKSTGEVGPAPLAKVYHEERRGATLLQLVQEASATGWVAQVPEVEVVPAADFTQEAPHVERFYGRTKEVEAVLRAVEDKPVVVVLGFAGIGKTTLGAKVCDHLRGTRALFWRRIRPWDSSSDLAARLGAFLRAQGRLSLHNLMSLPEAKELSRIEEVLAVDLVGLRALMIFDDVHEASEDAWTFLELLTRTLRHTKGATALFLSRSAMPFYSQRELILEETVAEVLLGGLDKRSSAALLSEAGVPTALINEFAQSSGGNPLFLQLFARDPHTGPRKEGWNAVATYIAEQVEPFLDPAERDCLEAACLCDVPVSSDALLLEGRAALKTLVGIRRKGLLGQVGAGQYVLHDTLKEFFLKTLATERKAPLAAKIVQWLRTRGEEAAKRGDPLEAVGYLNNAAKLESDRGKWATMMERIGELRLFMGHVNGAERAFRSALREVTDPRAQARLHGRLAQTFQYDLLRVDEAYREIDEGLSHLPPEANAEAVPLYIRRADIALFERDFDRMADAAERATDFASQLPHGDELRARAALSRVRLRNQDVRRFDLAAIEADCRMASDVFEKSGNDWLATVAWGELANALLRAGRVDAAVDANERSLSFARASGHQFNIGASLAGLATILGGYIGDYERADALLQDKLKHTRKSGNSHQFFETYLDFANLFRWQRRYEEARESLEYFLQMTSQGILYRLTLTWWLGGRLSDLTLMSRLCARCGDAGSAEKYFRQAQELASTRPPETSAFELAWSEATLESIRGNSEKADEHYRRALSQTIPFLGQRMAHEDEPRAECLMDYARFLAAQGHKDAAREHLEGALGIFESHPMKPSREEADEALKALSA